MFLNFQDKSEQGNWEARAGDDDYISKNPTFKCDGGLSATVEYTGDRVLAGFELTTSTSVQSRWKSLC